MKLQTIFLLSLVALSCCSSGFISSKPKRKPRLQAKAVSRKTTKMRILPTITQSEESYSDWKPYPLTCNTNPVHDYSEKQQQVLEIMKNCYTADSLYQHRNYNIFMPLLSASLKDLVWTKLSTDGDALICNKCNCTFEKTVEWNPKETCNCQKTNFQEYGKTHLGTISDLCNF